MNDYLPYEKIAESSEKWELTAADWKRLRRIEWVVTEKIHGANFCFVVTAGGIRCANRKAFLQENDSFFGFATVCDDLTDNLRAAFAWTQRTEPVVESIFLYGELFGGGYPHPEVPPVAGVQPVQTGVWYAPDIRFIVFDVRLETPDGARYLDFADAVTLCAETGLPLAEPLFVGKYEKALDYPVRFDSTIPARFNLLPLPSGTNAAEGIVIKPWREAGLSVRPVLKRKIPEFAEDKRFHEAEKWDEAPAHGGAVDLLRWEAYCRLTENRWHTAVSKVGPERKAEAFSLFVAEVQEEAANALPELYATLSVRQQEELIAYTREGAMIFLDGDF
jgi:Rnl2 family RNA ligase